MSRRDMFSEMPYLAEVHYSAEFVEGAYYPSNGEFPSPCTKGSFPSQKWSRR
jgi:hypothetical protein